MQIKKLVIDNNKCLVDFKIDFQIIDGGSSTILIGENGTGKTTMLESILEILMSFDSDAIEKRINYSYEFEYFYAGKKVLICQSDKYYRINIEYENICVGKMKTVRKYLQEKNISIFPERIVSFYSGANNKMLGQINRINRNYTKKCRDALRQYRNVIAHGTVYDSDFPRRKYNSCIEELTPVYLTAILCGGDSYEKRYLVENCHFGLVQDITISIDIEKLPWTFHDINEDWKEELNYFIEFLDERFVEAFQKGYLYRSRNSVYYELKNLAELKVDSISIYNFFEKLQTLVNAEFAVFVSVGENRVNCDNLSEGQRQLIKVLGMLGICKSEDCLVLMDEPDAHMNPRWKYHLKETIDKSLKEAVNTQAIIATHDPLVINGVEKEFIRIFAHNDTLVANNGFYFTKIIEPTEDTKGMGIDGLLQSQYYGLKTSYDKESSDQFVKRQDLYIKLINGEINEDEKNELRILTKELGSLPISYNSIDFLYDDFIKIYRQTDLYSKEYLSYADIIRRRNLIEKIITTLYEG